MIAIELTRQRKHPRESGQIAAELCIALLLVFLPLLAGGAYWAHLEWNRFRCAYFGFFQARHQLIVTNQAVQYPIHYGNVSEEIDLVPLETLDVNHGPLGLGEVTNEVLELSKHSSSFLPSLRDLVFSSLLPEPLK
jgi:hypothetical protein